jgi:amino acid permease
LEKFFAVIIQMQQNWFGKRYVYERENFNKSTLIKSILPLVGRIFIHLIIYKMFIEKTKEEIAALNPEQLKAYNAERKSMMLKLLKKQQRR